MATNFSKILALQDRHGRSALHYAAVADDGGAMYKVLWNVDAADTTIMDENGNTADFYRSNPYELPYTDLRDFVFYANFGASEGPASKAPVLSNWVAVKMAEAGKAAKGEMPRREKGGGAAAAAAGEAKDAGTCMRKTRR